LHPTDGDATVLLRPSQGGLGGLDDLDGFPASGSNPYPSGGNVFFAGDGENLERPLTLPIGGTVLFTAKFAIRLQMQNMLCGRCSRRRGGWTRIDGYTLS